MEAEGAAGPTRLSKLLFPPRSCRPLSSCSTLYPKSTAAPRSRPCTAPPTPRTSTRARWPPPGCPCSELCSHCSWALLLAGAAAGTPAVLPTPRCQAPPAGSRVSHLYKEAAPDSCSSQPAGTRLLIAFATISCSGRGNRLQIKRSITIFLIDALEPYFPLPRSDGCFFGSGSGWVCSVLTEVALRTGDVLVLWLPHAKCHLTLGSCAWSGKRK